MNRRVTTLVAGTALAASVVVGVTPAGALRDAPVAAAAADREYCTGLDSYSVHRLYKAYFLREPDAGGLAYWEDILASGRLGLGGIAQLFAQSAEFTERYGQLSNRAFVELLYRNVMGRDGDAEGIAWWTGVLDRGHGRGDIMVGFSDSAEFKERTGLVPPVPTATDPQVLPEEDPVTVHPGGELVNFSETDISRTATYWYPIEVPIGEIFRYTGKQMMCMGWTIRSRLPEDRNEGQAIVSSANNLVVGINAFQKVIDIDPETYEYEMVNELVVTVRHYMHGDPWLPERPGR